MRLIATQFSTRHALRGKRIFKHLPAPILIFPISQHLPLLLLVLHPPLVYAARSHNGDAVIIFPLLPSAHPDVPDQVLAPSLCSVQPKAPTAWRENGEPVPCFHSHRVLAPEADRAIAGVPELQ